MILTLPDFELFVPDIQVEEMKSTLVRSLKPFIKNLQPQYYDLCL